MLGGRGRRALIAAAAIGGGGAAATTARLVRRRRELHWLPSERQRHQAHLSVQTVGEGRSPVILLHPLSGSSTYFGSAFDELGNPGPLLVPDLLGFGESPRPDHGYGPDQQVSALVDTLDELGVTDPGLWVGHGVGAVLALRAAATHPDRVRAVVAISPLLYRDQAAARTRIRRLSPMELGGPLNRNLAKAIYAGPGPGPGLAGQLARLWRVDLPGGESSGTREPSEATYREMLESCVYRADGWRWFDQISAPVQLVLPANDPLPDSRLLAELGDRYPRVTLSVLPFGDHRLPLTHPDGCLAAIDRFRSSEAG